VGFSRDSPFFDLDLASIYSQEEEDQLQAGFQAFQSFKGSISLEGRPRLNKAFDRDVW
jgi:hypothetical protein